MKPPLKAEGSRAETEWRGTDPNACGMCSRRWSPPGVIGGTRGGRRADRAERAPPAGICRGGTTSVL